MGGILEKLIDKEPDIIGKAAQSPLGPASLSVLVLGAGGFLLFQDTAGELKLLAFAMITGGFLGFLVLVVVFANNPKPAPIPPRPGKNGPEKTALGRQAAKRLAEAKRLRLAGRNDQARAAYGDAIALYKQIGIRRGQANVLRRLGDLESTPAATIRPARPMATPSPSTSSKTTAPARPMGYAGFGDSDRTLGRNDQTRAAYGDTIALNKQQDNRPGQANVLRELGDLERKLGRNDQTRAAYGDTALNKQQDNRPGQANVLRELGDFERKLGRNDQARAAYGDTIALNKQQDNRHGQANVLRELGELERKLGRNDQARAAYGDAIALYKQQDNRLGQANVLRGLGDLERKLGRNDQARAAYGDAIALYQQIGIRLGLANVLRGLGTLNSRKNPKQAAAYFVEAAQLYKLIGMTEAHDAALREGDKLHHDCEHHRDDRRLDDSDPAAPSRH